MMKRVKSVLLVCALTFAAPAVTSACLFPWFCSDCSGFAMGLRCGGCGHACPQQCGPPCAPPPLVTAPPPAPLMMPQACVQHRHVTVNQYHRERVVTRVPVTRYQDVTVDEGGYQTVWVSRPVTRRVARTEYRDQVSWRTVARPVTQRVAEVRTRMVPAPRTAWVGHTGCGECLSGSSAYAPLPYHQPIVSQVPPLIDSATVPAIPRSTASRPILGAPEFVDDSAYGDWTTVPSTSADASATDVQTMSYETNRRRRASRFVPVRSSQLPGSGRLVR